MLLLSRITLASAWLLTVGVSLARDVQTDSSDSPPPSPPPASGPASASSPPPPAPGKEASTHEQAVPAGAGGSSRGDAPMGVVEPIALKDVSVDSEGIVRVGRDGVFSIEAHPTGRYVRVHDVEVTYVNETGAAGYDVGTPKFHVRADGRVEQQHEEVLRLHGGLHDPKNLGTSTPFVRPHPAPGDDGGGSGNRAGTIRVVGKGQQVSANSADGFEVEVGGEGGVVYHDGGGAHEHTEDFEAAFNYGGGHVEYRVGSGGGGGRGGSSIKVKPEYVGSFVSPARRLATYLEYSTGFEWSSREISLHTNSSAGGAGEVAYGGPHHGFGAILSQGAANRVVANNESGGEISYAANEGGYVLFSIRPHFGGSVVSGPHAFGAHLAEGYVVEYYKRGNNNNVNGGGGDSFKLYAPGLRSDGGIASGIASGRHGFAASLSHGGRVEYRSGESFSIEPTEGEGTVVSGAHGFAAHLELGGRASYEMVDNSFKLHATYKGEVSSLRHHHFSAKVDYGGSIEHFGDELGKFTVVAYRNGEVTYGGGGAGHGGKDEKKNVRVQLRRPIWSFDQRQKTPETGSIRHEPEEGFVVEVKGGPSTVTIGTTATGGDEQQHVVPFKGAGTVRFDSSGRDIKTTGEVGKEDE